MTSSTQMTWQDDLATPITDTGFRYTDGSGTSPPPSDIFAVFDDLAGANRTEEAAEEQEESLKDQVKGFAKATGELVVEFGRGVGDLVVQSLEGAGEWNAVKNVRRPVKKLGGKLEFLNEFLPEDRDPVRSWVVVVCVFFVAFCVLYVNDGKQTSVLMPKKLYIHPPSANHVVLPDGRHMAYHEQGVSAERARFSMIAPHPFLSSRLAGIPGVKASLLDEFGVRLVTFDLPGFGESDPHPGRNLNTSAVDMLHLANSLGVLDKFWVMGYSEGSKHAWAAVHYIPERLAGVAMFAPMGNPYDSSMTKEEKYRSWEKWSTKRKLMYVLARRFPSLLSYFYRRSFLSGVQGQLEKWLSISLGKKDKALIEEQIFREFWERDVEESVRQWDPKPFVEEAVLEVSDWGFNLADLQVQKNNEGGGLFFWLKSIFSHSEKEWAGFLGPIHIWQGMDDRVVPPSMTEFVGRVFPGATVHRLHDEGHFSYFCFCDECHRQVFSTLFGVPQGPLPEPFMDGALSSLSEGSGEEIPCQETPLESYAKEG